MYYNIYNSRDTIFLYSFYNVFVRSSMMPRHRSNLIEVGGTHAENFSLVFQSLLIIITK